MGLQRTDLPLNFLARHCCPSLFRMVSPRYSGSVPESKVFEPGVVKVPPIVNRNFLVAGLVAPQTFNVLASDVLSMPLGVICDIARIFLVIDSF